MQSTGQRFDSPSARFDTAISSPTPTFFILWVYCSLMGRGAMARRVRAHLMGIEKRTGEDAQELPWDAVCSTAAAVPAVSSSCLRNSVSWPSSSPAMLAALWVPRCYCWRNWARLGDCGLMTQVPRVQRVGRVCRLNLASWCRVATRGDNAAEPLPALTRRETEEQTYDLPMMARTVCPPMLPLGLPDV